MNVMDLTKKDGIHCTTEEEAKEICALFHSLGLTWHTGQSYIERTSWDNVNDGIYYYPFYFGHKEGGFATCSIGGNVYPAQEFLEKSIINQFLIT
jgi:hypothetical protein